MGINTAWDTFSVTVLYREDGHFILFSLNFLCPKTMEIIANLKQYLYSVDLLNFKLCSN